MAVTVALLSLALGTGLTFFIRKAALKTGFVDIPVGKLKVHEGPVPYAGTAIFLTFMIALLGVRFFTNYPTGTLRQLRGIVFGGGFVFVLGIIDDMFDLSYPVKFLGQAAAALILIYYGIMIQIFPLEFLNVLFSILWVLLIVNSLNIVDVMDGLASGVGAIAALGFFAVTLPGELVYVRIASAVLFGSLAGFWYFNRPPAKVFMGDAGSLFAGFILAALSMGAEYSGANLLGLFAPVFILLIPIYDTLLVIYFRWRSGRAIFKGSRDHFAIRLSSQGFSDWKINLIAYTAAFVFGAAAFLVTVSTPGIAFLIISLVFFLAIAGTAVLSGFDPHTGQ